MPTKSIPARVCGNCKPSFPPICKAGASTFNAASSRFAKLKPAKITLDGKRNMTVKEAILTLAPTLERMKKRGFGTQEIVEKLHEKGIEIKPPTLAKYLNEYKRGKGKKKDTPPPPAQTEKIVPAPKLDKPAPVSYGGFTITPDTPLDEL